MKARCQPGQGTSSHRLSAHCVKSVVRAGFRWRSPSDTSSKVRAESGVKSWRSQIVRLVNAAGGPAWQTELKCADHSKAQGASGEVVMTPWKRCGILKVSTKHCIVPERQNNTLMVQLESVLTLASSMAWRAPCSLGSLSLCSWLSIHCNSRDCLRNPNGVHAGQGSQLLGRLQPGQRPVDFSVSWPTASVQCWKLTDG